MFIIRWIKKIWRFFFKKKLKLKDILEDGEEFDHENDKYEEDTLGARELTVLLDENEEFDYEVDDDNIEEVNELGPKEI